MVEKMKFEDTPWRDIEIQSHFYYVIKDKYPVTEGHILFVPKTDTHENLLKCYEAAHLWGNSYVKDGYCDGYNIGMNVGEAAGQTVMYPHVHLIPRRSGDMKDPRGGVRHVIPEKGNYKKDQVNTDDIGDVIYGDGC